MLTLARETEAQVERVVSALRALLTAGSEAPPQPAETT
jgi:hypothetical protein